MMHPESPYGPEWWLETEDEGSTPRTIADSSSMWAQFSEPVWSEDSLHDGMSLLPEASSSADLEQLLGDMDDDPEPEDTVWGFDFDDMSNGTNQSRYASEAVYESGAYTSTSTGGVSMESSLEAPFSSAGDDEQSKYFILDL
eukprot:4672278-Amphidinium_carterae.1